MKVDFSLKTGPCPCRSRAPGHWPLSPARRHWSQIVAASCKVVHIAELSLNWVQFRYVLSLKSERALRYRIRTIHQCSIHSHEDWNELKQLMQKIERRRMSFLSTSGVWELWFFAGNGALLRFFTHYYAIHHSHFFHNVFHFGVDYAALGEVEMLLLCSLYVSFVLQQRQRRLTCILISHHLDRVRTCKHSRHGCWQCWQRGCRLGRRISCLRSL